MESKVYEAAVEGSVESLLSLLQEDALILDRFMVSCYSDTPLHIASMLGHLDFVQEILTQKPELAGELNSGNSSPLHLATAKGYLDIVKKLVAVNPEMCFVCDRDGKNPLHVAAMKGHVSVLRELVRVRPQAARALMDRSETILHACVCYNKLEAMKFLVETMNDHEFVNSKDEDGNTILHLAAINKQVEAIQFLTAKTAIEVNALNANGFTALDVLAQRKLDLKEWKIAELLCCAGATSAKNILLSPKGSVLKPHDHNHCKRPKKARKKQAADNWLEKKRNALMVVASLIAAMAFQAGLNPPAGVWQDTSLEQRSNMSIPHVAGYPIMASNKPFYNNSFFLCNTTGFVASLSIILLLISGLPCFKSKFFIWILMVIMWVAITAMTLAYVFAVAGLALSGTLFCGYMYILMAWFGLTVLLILGHLIRLMVKMIKLMKRRREPPGSLGREPLHIV